MTDSGIIGFMLLDLESLAEVYMQQMERADFVRSVAAGEPASIVAARVRCRRRVTQ